MCIRDRSYHSVPGRTEREKTAGSPVRAGRMDRNTYMETVSYTHLDVYKRQGQDARRFQKTQKVLNHDEMAQPSYG